MFCNIKLDFDDNILNIIGSNNIPLVIFVGNVGTDLDDMHFFILLVTLITLDIVSISYHGFGFGSTHVAE